jgi:hypothetical protein
MEQGVMEALLKSVYEKKLISEDTYHHALENLPKVLDYGAGFGYNVIRMEDHINECASN